MCSLYIREHKNDFSIGYLQPPQEFVRKDLRLTVDYPEDLVVCRTVYKKFIDEAPQIPVKKIVAFLDENIGLKKIISPYCEEGYETMYL